jgi:diaminopimelate epimerase
MRFTKMQGAGNDYVYVDCFAERVAEPARVAPRITDRHFGVGGDGLVLILPAEAADARMRMFNADGSEAEMCGNAVRCVAKYVYDHGLSRANPMRIQTGRGVLAIQLAVGPDGKASGATVDMGEPILEPAKIPVGLAAVVDAPIAIGRRTFRMTCVSMGNPHAVFYVRDLSAKSYRELAPKIEVHPAFPRKVNVHFVQVVSPEEVRMWTWERGSGFTLACGTGASAVCVAGVLTGKTGRSILAHLPGGDLQLEWRQADNHVYMTGPAQEVFSGDWPE